MRGRIGQRRRLHRVRRDASPAMLVRPHRLPGALRSLHLQGTLSPIERVYTLMLTGRRSSRGRARSRTRHSPWLYRPMLAYAAGKTTGQGLPRLLFTFPICAVLMIDERLDRPEELSMATSPSDTRIPLRRLGPLLLLLFVGLAGL